MTENTAAKPWLFAWIYEGWKRRGGTWWSGKNEKVTDTIQLKKSNALVKVGIVSHTKTTHNRVTG